jgi:hypothetical protein
MWRKSNRMELVQQSIFDKLTLISGNYFITLLGFLKT